MANISRRALLQGIASVPIVGKRFLLKDLHRDTQDLRLPEHEKGEEGAFFYVSLHTGNPGRKRSKHELTYKGYKPVPVPRTPDGWIIRGGVATNANDITFPETPSGAYELIRYFGLGTDSGLLYSSRLEMPLQLSGFITPIFQAGEIRIEA